MSYKITNNIQSVLYHFTNKNSICSTYPFCTHKKYEYYKRDNTFSLFDFTSFFYDKTVSPSGMRCFTKPNLLISPFF